MFDFAISQQKKHPPSRRLLASMVVSLSSHLLMVLALIEYPQLIGPGLKNWLKHPVLFSPPAQTEPVWRTVTFLGKKNGKMQLPSADTLKQLTYDWQTHKDSGRNPPISLRWNGDLANAGDKKPGPIPKPVPGLQEPKPVPTVAGETPAPVTQQGLPSGTASPPVSVAGNETAGGRGTTVYLPPPKPSVEPKQIPPKTAETAAMVAPTSIPKEGTNTPPPQNLSKSTSAAAQNPPPQVFENQQKAIQSEGSGLFDTKGFPLGEYASLIIERVKGNWSIPSNLRNSQGRTTVIFFIDKDGRFTDARIVMSSGSSSLDLAALNAIIGSNPFPPLPKGFPGNHVGAKFVFSYNERQ